MADKAGKYLFGILVPILLSVGLIEYMHTSAGVEFFASMLGGYPFADQIMKVIRTVVGYQNEIPIISTSSVMFDITKLLISAMIKSGVVSLLLGIFCAIPDFDQGSLRRAGIDRIEAAERYMNRPGYLLKALFINVIASVIVVGISNEILRYVDGYLSNRFNGSVQAVLSGTLMAATIVLAVAVMKRAAAVRLGVAFLWVIFSKIFPKILDVFGLNVLCLCLYASLYTYGFQTKALGWVVAIFVWCLFADIVKRSLRRAVVGRE